MPEYSLNETLLLLQEWEYRIEASWHRNESTRKVGGTDTRAIDQLASILLL